MTGKKHPSIISIRPHNCHCGNITEGPTWRDKHPHEAPKSKQTCCIICRCDEHRRDGSYRTNYELADYSPSCGAYCIYHDPSERRERIKVLENRVIKYNSHTGVDK